MVLCCVANQQNRYDSIYVTPVVISSGNIDFSPYFSLVIATSMKRSMHVMYFVFVLFQCLHLLFFLIRSDISDDAISYIVNHVGYCDNNTEFIFSHSVLYPSIPENPQFSTLPHCKWQDLLSVYPGDDSLVQSYFQLLHLLQWNQHVFESFHDDGKENPDDFVNEPTHCNP